MRGTFARQPCPTTTHKPTRRRCRRRCCPSPSPSFSPSVSLSPPLSVSVSGSGSGSGSGCLWLCLARALCLALSRARSLSLCLFFSLSLCLSARSTRAGSGSGTRHGHHLAPRCRRCGWLTEAAGAAACARAHGRRVGHQAQQGIRAILHGSCRITDANVDSLLQTVAKQHGREFVPHTSREGSVHAAQAHTRAPQRSPCTRRRTAGPSAPRTA